MASESEAHLAVARLAEAGLLTSGTEGTVRHSEKGNQLFTTLSRSIEEITHSLYGDLSPSDLEATHRTLTEIARRAHALLESK